MLTHDNRTENTEQQVTPKKQPSNDALTQDRRSQNHNRKTTKQIQQAKPQNSCRENKDTKKEKNPKIKKKHPFTTDK